MLLLLRLLPKEREAADARDEIEPLRLIGFVTSVVTISSMG